MILNSIVLISDASLIGLGISIVTLNNLNLSVAYHHIAFDIEYIDEIVGYDNGSDFGEDFTINGNDAEASG